MAARFAWWARSAKKSESVSQPSPLGFRDDLSSFPQIEGVNEPIRPMETWQ
jgi:hypothetical protein